MSLVSTPLFDEPNKRESLKEKCIFFLFQTSDLNLTIIKRETSQKRRYISCRTHVLTNIAVNHLPFKIHRTPKALIHQITPSIGFTQNCPLYLWRPLCMFYTSQLNWGRECLLMPSSSSTRCTRCQSYSRLITSRQSPLGSAPSPSPWTPCRSGAPRTGCWGKRWLWLKHFEHDFQNVIGSGTALKRDNL